MHNFPDRTPNGRYRLHRLLTRELDRVRIDGRDGGLDIGGPSIGEDGHYPGPLSCGRCPARQSGQPRGFRDRQAAGCSRNEVQADGVGAGSQGGEHSLGIGDAADLDDGLPRLRRHVVWHRTGGDERTGRRGRIG